MAFLCTFTGLTVAGVIWMGIWVELDGIGSPVSTAIAGWLSPRAVSGWCFYLVLSVACAWLTYRMLRSKLGREPPEKLNE